MSWIKHARFGHQYAQNRHTAHTGAMRTCTPSWLKPRFRAGKQALTRARLGAGNPIGSSDQCPGSRRPRRQVRTAAGYRDSPPAHRLLQVGPSGAGRCPAAHRSRGLLAALRAVDQGAAGRPGEAIRGRPCRQPPGATRDLGPRPDFCRRTPIPQGQQIVRSRHRHEHRRTAGQIPQQR